MITQTSKAGQVFTKLVTQGGSLSAAEAKAMGIGNLSAEVSRIRAEGFAIYGNRKVSNGVAVTEYRHGKANRALIAAGYRAIAAGI